MRKTAFCLCKNNGADQPCGSCAGDQHLCFSYMYIDNTIPLLSEPLPIFSCCTAQFVSDLVDNPEDKFSHNVAYMYNELCLYID